MLPDLAAPGQNDLRQHIRLAAHDGELRIKASIGQMSTCSNSALLLLCTANDVSYLVTAAVAALCSLLHVRCVYSYLILHHSLLAFCSSLGISRLLAIFATAIQPISAKRVAVKPLSWLDLLAHSARFWFCRRLYRFLASSSLAVSLSSAQLALVLTSIAEPSVAVKVGQRLCDPAFSTGFGHRELICRVVADQ